MRSRKKLSLARHPGVVFWSIFAVALILLLLFNRKVIISNLYSLGINLPSFLRQQVASAPAGTEEDGMFEMQSAPAPAQNPAIENFVPELPPIPIEQLAPDVTQPLTVLNSGDSPGVSLDEQARTLYFLSIDQNGNLHRVAVKRMLPDTEAPLAATLRALLAGLSKIEEERRLISLIPEGTELLSVAIQQGIAYVNFNEEFLYNTHGKDGYAGQINQVLWTATEFPTVKKVQILIEGRRESYLGENVWIGSALEREQFPNF
ncbi:MAG: GerMN domain-containing protein [Treponema sp.]|jgi:spore germination protein GerM|nr:GerMN domain-containing protein [Treponema sp.]